MNTALDDFERMLVSAASQLGASATDGGEALKTPPGRKGAARRRRLGGLAALPLAWLAVGATALAAGGGVTAWVLLNNGNTAQTLASFECSLTHTSTAGVPAVTGSPLTDCAAWWPSATGGHASAPSLSAWVGVANVPVPFNAVVRPTAWGRPPTDWARFPPNAKRVLVHWQPLPSNWTVNLGVVVLTDQLNAIPSGMSPTTPCTYANHAVGVVRGLLAADNLRSWHVVLQASRGSVSSACRPIIPNVDGGIRTVQLVQLSPAKTHRPPTLPHDEQKLLAENRVLNQTIVSAQQRISTTLAHRCVSVSQAAANWTTVARRAGLNQTTLAYYRELNTGQQPIPSRLLDYYTLVKQPATQNTGRCAHVLVMRYGGGAIVVYAARIAP